MLVVISTNIRQLSAKILDLSFVLQSPIRVHACVICCGVSHVDRQLQTTLERLFNKKTGDAVAAYWYGKSEVVHTYPLNGFDGLVTH